MQIPSVRARVEELINAPEDRIRAGIDAEFLMLRNRAASEDLDADGRANVDLGLKLLMAHTPVSRLDRRQEANCPRVDSFGRGEPRGNADPGRPVPRCPGTGRPAGNRGADYAAERAGERAAEETDGGIRKVHRR